MSTSFHDGDMVRSRASRPDAMGRGLLYSVVEELGRRILGGFYRVGQSIPTEPALMAELRVSRTVLREALKILIAKGLIESRPKIGTRVRPKRDWNMLDPTILRLYCGVTDYADFAVHFQQLRLMIEPAAAAAAAAHRSEAQMATIEAAYASMAVATTSSEWADADLDFHLKVLEATGNPFIIPLGSLIHEALENFLHNSARSSPDPHQTLGLHSRVVEAIRSQDAAAAQHEMANLLGHTTLAVTQIIAVGQSPQATSNR